MDYEYIKLKKYLRESFPEHADLTLAETLAINNDKFNFIDFIDYEFIGESINGFIIEELFKIDIIEFFEQNINELPDILINDDSLHYHSINDVFYFDLYDIETEDTGIFFEHDLDKKEKNNKLFIKYKNKKFKYNHSNFKHIMSEFVSDKKTSPENLFLSFLYGYITENTDLTNFFHINISSNKIKIETYYNEHTYRYYGRRKSNDLCKDVIFIDIVNTDIRILDYNSHILFQKNIHFINKNNFFNEIMEPLKNVIIGLDNIRQENYQIFWEQDLYNYISSYQINEKDLTAIKIRVFQPEIESVFLNKIPYTKKPKTELSFILNNNIVSTWTISEASPFDVDSDEFWKMYRIYKNMEQVYLENIKLNQIFSSEVKQGKVKRI